MPDLEKYNNSPQYAPQQAYYAAPIPFSSAPQPAYNANSSRPMNVTRVTSSSAPQSRNRNNSRPQRTKKQDPIEPIPLPYSELYPKLLQNRVIAPKYLRPMEPRDGKFPEWYDANARCEYHAGAVGHHTDNCVGLKRAVQDLRNAGVIQFNKPNPPPTRGGINAPTKDEISCLQPDGYQGKERMEKRLRIIEDEEFPPKRRKVEKGRMIPNQKPGSSTSVHPSSCQDHPAPVRMNAFSPGQTKGKTRQERHNQRPQFAPIPLSCGESYPKLLQSNLVAPRESPSLKHTSG